MRDRSPGGSRGRGNSSLLIRAAVVAFAANAALTATLPMVSYRALEIGATPAQLGLLAACFPVLAFFVAIPSGRWMDRWGAARFVLAGVLLMVAADLALIVAGQLVTIGLCAAAVGLGFTFTAVGIPTTMAGESDAVRNDRALAMFSVFTAVGMICGPLMVGLLAGSLGLGADAVFAACAALMGAASLLAVVLVVGARRAGAEERSTAAAVGVPREALVPAVFRVVRLPSMLTAIVASLAFTASMDVITIYLPAYGESVGLSVGAVGVLLAVHGAAMIVSRMLVVPLVRLMGRRRLLVASLLLPATAVALVPLAGSTSVVIGVLLFLTGFGLGLGTPLTLSWVSFRAPLHDRGMAFGARLTGNRAGQFAVPVVAGVMAGVTGVGAVFLTLAALLGGSAVLVQRSRFVE